MNRCLCCSRRKASRKMLLRSEEGEEIPISLCIECYHEWVYISKEFRFPLSTSAIENFRKLCRHELHLEDYEYLAYKNEYQEVLDALREVGIKVSKTTLKNAVNCDEKCLKWIRALLRALPEERKKVLIGQLNTFYKEKDSYVAKLLLSLLENSR